MMKVYRAAAGLLCIEFVTGDPSRFLLTKSLGPFDDDHQPSSNTQGLKIIKNVF